MQKILNFQYYALFSSPLQEQRKFVKGSNIAALYKSMTAVVRDT